MVSGLGESKWTLSGLSIELRHDIQLWKRPHVLRPENIQFPPSLLRLERFLWIRIRHVDEACRIVNGHLSYPISR